MEKTHENQVENGAPAGSLATIELPMIDAARPAGEQIYLILRGAILEMALPPSCVVSEAEIGTKIGSSRTPVREALLRLRQEGLIRTLPSRGNFVSKLSRPRILEAQFLREGLEVANGRRLAIQGLPEMHEHKLRQNLLAQEAAAQSEDYATFHIHDDEFHLALAEATGFARAAIVLEREKMQLDRLRALSLRVEGHLNRLLTEHRAMFDAIVQRDEMRTIEVTEHHCRSVLDVMADLTERHQEYFDE